MNREQLLKITKALANVQHLALPTTAAQQYAAHMAIEQEKEKLRNEQERALSLHFMPLSPEQLSDFSAKLHAAATELNRKSGKIKRKRGWGGRRFREISRKTPRRGG